MLGELYGSESLTQVYGQLHSFLHTKFNADKVENNISEFACIR